MKKQESSKVLFLERDFFFRFYIRRLFKKSKIDVKFKRSMSNNSNTDFFVVSSDLIEDLLKDPPLTPFLLVLNRKTNKFKIIDKFSTPKKLQKEILSFIN